MVQEITVYEQILTDMTAVSGTTTDKVKLDTFIGKQGQCSALAERARLQAHNIQRDQRVVALEVPFVTILSQFRKCLMFLHFPDGCRRTKVPQRFKPA